jgi:hypothetical protein
VPSRIAESAAMSIHHEAVPSQLTVQFHEIVVT